MSNVITTECIPCNDLRILITDDEPFLRKIFRISLLPCFPNCTIDLACNGAEAVQSFQQSHHGVVLMDIEMPIMDGLTAFDSICELCEGKKWIIPDVIFCTGSGLTPSIKMRVEKDPRHGFIQKPFPVANMRAAVKVRLPAAR
jgi:CheY-like chemotaxis protein